MYILGLGDVTHDTSVCLMKDGEVVSAIELERLTRVKHNLKIESNHYTIAEQGHYVSDALSKWTQHYREEQLQRGINYCLEAAGIEKNDVSSIVSSSLFTDAAFSTDVKLIDHHLSHCASTYFPSTYSDSAILAIDGYGFVNKDGSSTSTMFAVGEGNQLNTLLTIEGSHKYSQEELAQGCKNAHMVFENSIGVFYQNISMLLGMGYHGEGKTMGLASYGKPNSAFTYLEKHIDFGDNGSLGIHNREIFIATSEVIGDAKTNLNDAAFFAFKADLAYAHQSMLERMVIHLCLHLYDITKSTNICLAGGVALNSVANSKILNNTPFKNIFIQPAAGDNGISLGCAMYGAHTINNIPRAKKYFSPYTGKAYYNNNLPKVVNEKLDKYKINLNKEDVFSMVAQLISKGRIVGWYDGCSEFGPRALGSRSILADPRQESMKNLLNLKVKKREWFRPFAPAILEESVGDYFEDVVFSPYMLLVAKAKPLALKNIPAVVHVDNTSRLQTVNRFHSPHFYKVIKEFELLTGVPAILNTSFNVAVQAIVETPECAMDCFLSTPIDALVINGELYVKEHCREVFDFKQEQEIMLM
jgi:carbamoyltransferase